MQETWVWSLGREDPLEEKMALQYSCLENPLDRGSCRATVHGAAKNQTWLSTHPRFTEELSIQYQDFPYIHSYPNTYCFSYSYYILLIWYICYNQWKNNDILLLIEVHSLFRVPQFLPNVLFCSRISPRKPKQYISLSCLLGLLLAVTVSQTFPIFDDPDSFRGFPHSSVGKESACNAGDPGSVPGLGRSPGEGNGNPLQYSCLENSMDRGAWQATAHGVERVGCNSVSGVVVRYFTELMSFNLGLPAVFLIGKHGLWVFGRKTLGIQYHSHHIIHTRVHTNNMTNPNDVNHDHLAEAGFSTTK